MLLTLQTVTCPTEFSVFEGVFLCMKGKLIMIMPRRLTNLLQARLEDANKCLIYCYAGNCIVMGRSLNHKDQMIDSVKNLG